MAQFDTAIATAKRLIEKFGETSTHRRHEDGSPPDPNQPWNPGTETEVDTPVSAVWLNYDQKRVDGQLIKIGDQEVLIPGSDLSAAPDPETDLMLRASGEQWSIQSVDVLSPNGQRILYTLHCRQ